MSAPAPQLYAFNEHEKMQPASLAKIMTFYLTLEALHQNRIALDTQVNISEAAWRLSLNDSVSRMFLQVGQKVAVRDLLYGLMVSSGNDAAVALAEYLGGSSEAFAQQMNEKAQQLGLTETHFTNPDGLPTEGEYTTAADMVKLGAICKPASPIRSPTPRPRSYTWAAVGPEGKIKKITQATSTACSSTTRAPTESKPVTSMRPDIIWSGRGTTATCECCRR